MSAGIAARAATPDRAVHRRGLAIPIVLFALLALLPLAAAFGPKSYILSFGMRVMILAIAAVSLDLILGYGAMVSFGHAAFIGIGAYAAGILVTEGTGEALVGLPVALVASALFALVTGYVSIRTHGVAFIMITLAFGQMAYFVANSLSEYGGSDGLTLWTKATLAGTAILKNDVAFYYIILGCLMAVYVLCRAIVASRFGRALRGCKENPARMAALGFDIDRIRLAAYVVAGTIGGLAGFLTANQSEFVSPATMTWQRSGELIFMVVLGGMGSLHGAIVGAIAFLVTEEVLSGLTQHWKLIFGPLLVLVVLFARGGLTGLIGGGRNG